MAKENNIFNAANTVNNKKLNNDLYNNLAINRLIENMATNLKNKDINEKISDGTVFATGHNNVKNIISDQSSSSINTVISSTPNILDMTNVSKKYTDDLKKKEIEVKEEEITVVDSDPEKPDNLNDKIILSTKEIKEYIPTEKYKFSLNKLYRDTNRINIDENKYTNTLNNENINKNTIVSTSSHGIIVENPIRNTNSIPTYKLIPSEYLNQEAKVETTDFNKMPLETIKHNIFGHSTMHNQVVSNNVKTKELLKYKYGFGLSKISASQNLISKAAGFISAEIDVSNCGWIELETDNNDNVEFYILEEKNETPILPVGITYITDEKLFYGLMPRFTIKEPNSIVVKKNGEVTAINNLDDLYLFLSVNNTNVEVNQSSYLQENEYTISYKPDTDAKVYFPTTNKIRVKIIKRSIEGKKIYDINTVKIHKYNNNINWTMSSLADVKMDAPESSQLLT